ncbi:hypothetical protein LLE49_25735 [Alicyclobacillus tolerans]|uniref:hypothetical protein n=1 Tax=Alicyclobacillus tolerans TaxID=90970 RepID=UPI001F2AD36A|nr:hypothetical protein [Alicyclobacillus tolerans]MCF8568130.1 hypothetical protein [Alicyclobacillus tolerans]
MKKGILLKVSGVLTATVMLGSTLGTTANAATTSNKPSTGSSSKLSHVSISNSYDHSVVELIGRLQKQMIDIQYGSTFSRPLFIQPNIKRSPWIPGNLLPALATDLGISKSALQSDLQSGQTVAQIAAKHNMSSSTLISKLESAEASQLQAQVKRYESIADKSITRFVNETQPKVKHLIPQSTPGGPMIPASGPQSTPGGPMIPASGSQFTPGGPMIPAPATNSADAATYKQLLKAANTFVKVLQTEKKNGKLSDVSTDISQVIPIFHSLETAFQPSTNNAQYTSNTEFTSAQLSAIKTATQSLKKIVVASGVSTTTK